MTNPYESLVGDLRVRDYGDSAVLITGSSETDTDVLWQQVQRMADSLADKTFPGIEGIVATYDSLLVEFDPYVLERDRLLGYLLTSRRSARTDVESRTHLVPAVYGGAEGPDLDEVAAELDLAVADVVEQHSSALWRVAFRGAPAGAPMLDGSPFAAPIARCSHPRLRVPAGSVAVAGLQGVIYPIESPGGWRLIARTPLDLIDITRDPHLLYSPGDRFKFVPVSADEAVRWRGSLLGEST